jgi:hypothetical protein
VIALQRQDSAAKKCEAGTPIHLPFDQFESMYLALDLSAAPF